MARNRNSAKAAGTKFETLVTRYLRTTLDDDRIERRRMSALTIVATSQGYATWEAA